MNWDNTTLFSDDHPGDAAFRAEWDNYRYDKTIGNYELYHRR